MRRDPRHRAPHLGDHTVEADVHHGGEVRHHPVGAGAHEGLGRVGLRARSPPRQAPPWRKTMIGAFGDASDRRRAARCGRGRRRSGAGRRGASARRRWPPPCAAAPAACWTPTTAGRRRGPAPPGRSRGRPWSCAALSAPRRSTRKYWCGRNVRSLTSLSPARRASRRNRVRGTRRLGGGPNSDVSFQSTLITRASRGSEATSRRRNAVPAVHVVVDVDEHCGAAAAARQQRIVLASQHRRDVAHASLQAPAHDVEHCRLRVDREDVPGGPTARARRAVK